MNKYHESKANPQEVEAVERYYDLFADQSDATEQMSEQTIDDLEARIKSKIKISKDGLGRKEYPLYASWWLRIAAFLVLVMGLMVIRNHWQTSPNLAVNKTETINKKASEGDRFLNLPDGSKVLLRAGSQLTYKDNFEEGTREVILTGEAYFDVVHTAHGATTSTLDSKPFIIHTGKVKTTVLGTAFEIKAWPQTKEVTVTVSRGKVRVEDDKRIIAILTKDKQVSYNTETQKAGKKEVKVENELKWISKDMTFEEIPFGELASLLEKRYQVKIIFSRPELKDCSLTGRFLGTESLEEVIKILSITSSTRFKLEGDVLKISGKACL